MLVVVIKLYAHLLLQMPQTNRERPRPCRDVEEVPPACHLESTRPLDILTITSLLQIFKQAWQTRVAENLLSHVSGAQEKEHACIKGDEPFGRFC